VATTRIDRHTRPARAQGGNGRDALLRAAGAVFAERGYRDASVDEIAQRAGYSKGALYWHFASKDEVFFALLEERVDAPAREMVALLRSAPPEQDMAPEASRRLAELLRSERELLLLENEYWAQAVRDPKLRRRYVRRRAELRAALGQALVARLEHLGTPLPGAEGARLATVVLSLATGLAQAKLVEPRAVPDELFGDTLALIYRGFVARRAAGAAAPR
jgi:AcrR family transcriptional regulator